MNQGNGLIVSVSGIRGIVGDGLTPAIAGGFAAALGTAVQGQRVVLSQDGRPSGVMLRHAVLAGLLGTGCEVHDLGVTPTPTFGLAIRQLHAAGGIQITASHNPAAWNGLKLFGANGQVLTAEQGQRITNLFDASSFHWSTWNTLGKVTDCRQAEDWHCDRVLALVDVPRIRARQLRIFLDANGGAGGPLGRRLLESLHCQLITQGCNADGCFEHEPEPIEANLRTICTQVARQGADMGFVLDPDADRLALIDETGRYIGEELTLALAVLFRLRQAASSERGPVVINMSTSRVIEDIAHSFGVPCHRAAVGEAHVAESMRALGALLGGEGNGGVMDPRVGYVRDPFIGMGLILNLLADTGKKLSTLAAELPSYAIVKDKYYIERERLPALFTALATRWSGAVLNRIDGLRGDWSDQWVHVRSSNTEPIVRVIAEAKRVEEARRLCQEVKTLLQDIKIP